MSHIISSPYIGYSTGGGFVAIDVTIEKVWRHRKSTCIVLINHEMGARNGYCSVSMGHPFYKKKYSGDPVSDLKHDIDQVISAHGGITYSGDLEWALDLDHTLPKHYWWFGFDCLHANDAQDPELIKNPMMKKIILESEQRFSSLNTSRVIRDLEYVESECNKLAEDLAKYVFNSVDFILDRNHSGLHAV